MAIKAICPHCGSDDKFFQNIGELAHNISDLEVAMTGFPIRLSYVGNPRRLSPPQYETSAQEHVFGCHHCMKGFDLFAVAPEHISREESEPYRQLHTLVRNRALSHDIRRPIEIMIEEEEIVFPSDQESWFNRALGFLEGADYDKYIRIPYSRNREEGDFMMEVFSYPI